MKTLLSALLAIGAAASAPASVDLSRAVVVVRPGDLPPAEKTAAAVLVAEVEKRTGLRLETSPAWPEGRAAIAISAEARVPAWKRTPPARDGIGPAEGYRLILDEGQPAAPVVWALGNNPRGTLFAVGHLLRKLEWATGKLSLASPLEVTTAPAYPIRGHQLGYRTTANSYDAWTVAQMEQYIRELTFFGVNSIEAIPFHDGRPTPVMKLPRREMSRAMSEICHRYGLDYWAWVPADFDLDDQRRRAEMLARYDEFFADSKELTGIFFPGGDPGSNPPDLVMPFLEEVAARMRPRHPKAKIWLSLQGFDEQKVEGVYRYLDRGKPDWLAGLVAGPSSPPIPQTRLRLDPRYRLRLYPDLTHNKICQYQVPSWDQAYALTLGREAVNPRPAEFARIHNWFAKYTDGFISYSDGVHDDVNKTVWSALSWDPSSNVREVLIDYARVNFGWDVAGEAADGILALERNWRGPLQDNGSVEGTLLLWQRLEKMAPRLAANWRWQMCLLRANYDAYVRRRLIDETRLEQEANAILARASILGAGRAMGDAAEVLNRAVRRPAGADLRGRIIELCEQLFQSIGLQTSVKKYHASGAERGAVLDFIDTPLNNRWWLEDEFQKIRGLATEAEKVQRLRELATWESPGPGSFYDNLGNMSKSPHVVRTEPDDPEPDSELRAEPTFWWWDEGRSRARLSWQATMWPKRVVYEGLDPNGRYVLRSTGYGQALLRLNGDRVEPVVDGKEMGEFKEFPVPARYVKDRKLVLTWDRPTDEDHLNWRRRSRLAEVWLLKKE